jgi:hypothetical protein
VQSPESGYFLLLKKKAICRKSLSEMKLTTENLIKIGLAILLLVCLFDLPYGYYQLVRYLALVGFAILAYYENERKNIPMVIVFVALAILFQPFAKIGLGRQIWNIVDVIVALGLIISMFVRRKGESL